MIRWTLEGPHAYSIFISIGLLPLEKRSADAHSMMMGANVHSMTSMVFMRCMTLWGSANLQKSTDKLGQRVQGVCERPRDLHSHVWVVCREVLHIQFVRD